MISKMIRNTAEVSSKKLPLVQVEFLIPASTPVELNAIASDPDLVSSVAIMKPPHLLDSLYYFLVYFKTLFITY